MLLRQHLHFPSVQHRGLAAVGAGGVFGVHRSAIGADAALPAGNFKTTQIHPLPFLQGKPSPVSCRVGLIGMGNGAGTGLPHIGVKGETDPPLSHLHQPRRRKHPNPAFFHRLGHPYPGNQHRAALFIQGGLGGIEVPAVIQKLVPFGNLHGAAFFPKVHRKTGHHRIRRFPVGAKPHGGHQQHFPAGSAHIVRALPHPAVACIQPCLAAVLPMFQILALVQQHPAFPADRTAQHKVPAMLPSPDFGVSGVGKIPHFRVSDSRNRHLLSLPVVKGKPVGRTDGKLIGLHFPVQTEVDVPGIGGNVPHPGIKQHHLPILLHGTAGKAAVLIFPDGGEQRQALVLPMHQIPAHRMAPVHGTPSGGVGEILIKQVVLASVVQKAIGIIDPMIRRMKMQQRGFHQLPFLSIRQS